MKSLDVLIIGEPELSEPLAQDQGKDGYTRGENPWWLERFLTFFATFHAIWQKRGFFLYENQTVLLLWLVPQTKLLSCFYSKKLRNPCMNFELTIGGWQLGVFCDKLVIMQGLVHIFIKTLKRWTVRRAGSIGEMDRHGYSWLHELMHETEERINTWNKWRDSPGAWPLTRPHCIPMMMWDVIPRRLQSLYYPFSTTRTCRDWDQWGDEGVWAIN